MKNRVAVPIMALACIAAVETVALLKGINGTMLLASLCAMSGIGGFYLGRPTLTVAPESIKNEREVP